MNLETKITTYRLLALWAEVIKYEHTVAGLGKDFFERTIQAIKDDLAKVTERKELERILREFQPLMEQLAESLQDNTQKAGSAAGQRVLEQTSRILSFDGLVPGFENVKLTAAQLHALVVRDFTDYTKWFNDALQYEDVLNKAREALLRGKNPVDAAKELIEALDEQDPQTMRNIEAIIRTYVNSSANRANEKVYEANKKVISLFEWAATLEGGDVNTGRGTCVACAALDGQQWPTMEEAPSRPRHPNCRCLLVPVTKSWRELGIEADEWKDYSRKYKKVEEAGIFEDFEKMWAKQPKAWQDKAIGPTRAELVRSGKVKFSDLVDKNGDLIPLAELKKAA